ncbi:MAG: putative 2-dehydropantoate 2-reductase [Deltaproteobacteria bacterium]|nr:putative 2-dehydropantoate 2-reductase [Deltaproteobacteria bacterium]
MRIAVIGAGALGLFYGAMLQRAGNDVHFLLRRDHDAIMAGGLMVYSVDGDFCLPKVNGYRTPQEIGQADLVIVGLKTFANHRFQELLTPLVGDDTLILTLQNGLGNEEMLASLFGEERILGGVAFLCSNRGEPGVVHHLGEGRIILGEYLRGKTIRAEPVAALFRAAGVDCRVTPDYKKARWEKLVWNIPFNGLCALMLKPVDELLALDAMRRLIIDMMGEVIEGGNAQGLIKNIPGSLAENMVSFSINLGQYRPSMLIDRLEGRPLELDAIFGAPLAAAHEKGIEMPRVQELHALLQLAEKG